MYAWTQNTQINNCNRRAITIQYDNFLPNYYIFSWGIWTLECMYIGKIEGKKNCARKYTFFFLLSLSLSFCWSIARKYIIAGGWPMKSNYRNKNAGIAHDSRRNQSPLPNPKFPHPIIALQLSKSITRTIPISNKGFKNNRMVNKSLTKLDHISWSTDITPHLLV